MISSVPLHMPRGAAPGEIWRESDTKADQAGETRTKQAKKGNKMVLVSQSVPVGTVGSQPFTSKAADEAVTKPCVAPAAATKLMSVAHQSYRCSRALAALRVGNDPEFACDHAKLERCRADIEARVNQCLPTKMSKRRLERCLKELRFVLKQLGGNWALHQFGSAASGFNTVTSDLDVTCCLRSDLSPDLKAEAASVLSQRLAPIFRQHSAFEITEEILGARVPILKLCFENELEVDLSCHNLTPLVNTRLLREYCNLDQRIYHLGLAVKLWAKAVGVCGATPGNLSSYAFTLMMLYFLQVHPDVQLPVFPVEAFKKPHKLLAVASTRPSWRCTLLLVDLLKSFFRFYAEEFKWGTEVVSVRVGKRQMASEPMFAALRARQAQRIHIEDPVQLERNLHGYVEESHLRKLFCHALADMEADTTPIGLGPQVPPERLSSLPLVVMPNPADRSWGASPATPTSPEMLPEKAVMPSPANRSWGASALGETQQATVSSPSESTNSGGGSAGGSGSEDDFGKDVKIIQPVGREMNGQDPDDATLEGLQPWWQHMDVPEVAGKVAEALNVSTAEDALLEEKASAADSQPLEERQIPVEIPGHTGAKLLVGGGRDRNKKPSGAEEDKLCPGGDPFTLRKSHVSTRTSDINDRLVRLLEQQMKS